MLILSLSFALRNVLLLAQLTQIMRQENVTQNAMKVGSQIIQLGLASDNAHQILGILDMKDNVWKFVLMDIMLIIKQGNVLSLSTVTEKPLEIQPQKPVSPNAHITTTQIEELIIGYACKSVHLITMQMIKQSTVLINVLKIKLMALMTPGNVFRCVLMGYLERTKPEYVRVFVLITHMLILMFMSVLKSARQLLTSTPILMKTPVQIYVLMVPLLIILQGHALKIVHMRSLHLLTGSQTDVYLHVRFQISPMLIISPVLANQSAHITAHTNLMRTILL